MGLAASLSFGAIVFVSTFIPETKHLSVEQAVAVFEEGSSSSERKPSRQPS